MSIKISVALCTYNGSLFIEEQLQSILYQTRAVDEIIICDDRSTDDTLEKINLVKTSNPDVAWKIMSNDRNCGVIKNFEQAIGYCSGDIIFLSDQDDIWYNNKVEEVVNYFDTHISHYMVFTDGIIINGEGEQIEDSLWEKISFSGKMKNDWKNCKKAFSFLFRNTNKITGATIAFKYSLKEFILPISVPTGYLHDAWIGLIAAAKGGLGYIDKPLIKYRIHSCQYIGLGAGKGFSNDLSNSKSFYYFAFSVFKKYPINVLYYLQNALIRKMKKGSDIFNL